MKIKTLALLLALLPTSVFAATLNLTLGSYHVFIDEQKTNYNEINPGILYTWDSGMFAGAYYNSYSQWSPIVGKHWDWKYNFGGELGAAYYPEHEDNSSGPIRPFGQITYDIKQFRLGFSPVIYKDNRGIFTLQYVVPLD